MSPHGKKSTAMVPSRNALPGRGSIHLWRWPPISVTGSTHTISKRTTIVIGPSQRRKRPDAAHIRSPGSWPEARCELHAKLADGAVAHCGTGRPHAERCEPAFLRRPDLRE